MVKSEEEPAGQGWLTENFFARSIETAASYRSVALLICDFTTLETLD